MPLTQWKRHSDTCKTTLAQKGIPRDEQRLFKRCGCPCWVTGINPRTGKYHKHSLDCTSWEEGEKEIRRLLRGEEPVATCTDAGLTNLMLDDAIDRWTADRRRVRTGEGTISTTYRAFRTSVMRFAQKRKIRLLTQLNDEEVLRLLAAWELPQGKRKQPWKASTKRRQFEQLRFFFAFAVKRHWIEEKQNPIPNIDAPPTSRRQVDPYEPDEVTRLHRALENWFLQVRTNSSPWSLRPETLTCAVHVLEDTGTRGSDCLRIRPEELERSPSGDATWTFFPVKDNSHRHDMTDRAVTVYLRKETVEELDRVPRISARYPFMADPGNLDERDETFKSHVRHERAKFLQVLKRVGKVANVKDCRPHRFRHTFAVEKLKMVRPGTRIPMWSIEEVSRLLGHRTVAVTERYYAKWTRGRQDQLRDKVQAQWNAERKVVEILASGPRKKRA